MKKIKLYNELVFLFATILIAFSVAITIASDFGVSMVAAPSLILHLKFTFLTVGQWEYIFQAVVFIVMCIVIRRFRLIYFQAFLTGVAYGAILDLWRLIPVFNPENIADNMVLRVIFFIVGLSLTSLSVALFFKTYFLPQVHDFFVKAVVERYNLKQTIFKTGFDITYLVGSIIMSLVFFGGFSGIGIGTIIIVLINGTLIGLFGKLIDKLFVIEPLFPKICEYYEKN